MNTLKNAKCQQPKLMSPKSLNKSAMLKPLEIFPHNPILLTGLNKVCPCHQCDNGFEETVIQLSRLKFKLKCWSMWLLLKIRQSIVFDTAFVIQELYANWSTGRTEILPNHKQASTPVGKNFRTAPYYIMLSVLG